MFNKKLIKMLACFLSMSYLLATTSVLTVSANEEKNTNTQIFVLNEENNSQPPTLYDGNVAIPYDRNPPSSSNLYNLKFATYYGYIESFSWYIYTNYRFTNTTSIKVMISGNSMYEYTNDYLWNGRNIKVTLYNSSGTAIYSSQMDTVSDTFYAYFYNLDPTANYYVKISKTNDTIKLENINLEVSKA